MNPICSRCKDNNRLVFMKLKKYPKRYWCPLCGHIITISKPRHVEEEEKKEEPKKKPSLEELRKIRKEKSINKILKELRKNKYGIKGTIIIDGKSYEI